MSAYVVIGCGRFGSAVAKTLYSLGKEVLALDMSMDIIQNIADNVTQAVQVDATDETTLKSLGIRNYDVAIISVASDLEASIMATIIVKELGVPYVLCKAKNELQAKVLYKVGADRVVFPERDMGIRIAHNLVSKNVLEFVELDPKYSIMEILASDNWNGKSLLELNFRARYGINIVAIKRGMDVNISPESDDKVRSKDILVVIGEIKTINRLSEENA
ncbi:potassium channel family protein [Proteocatella sphenisci]|uniref:potassium channel family protein n=1 Tax=Proteocatella sphenisci TaxID=181070 RepID=UPI00048C50BC|nr:TrkA family potassium uptake protein [Proteocatella sphenisci]